MNKRQFLMAAVCAMAFAPALARADDDIMKNLINKPNAGAWTVYGAGQTNKKLRDKDVTGGGATQVKVSSRTTNPWDVAASAPIEGAIKKGDKLLVALWAKSGDTEGGAPGQVSLRAQISQAPYTSLGDKMLSISDKWTLYSLEVIADADYAKGSTNVTVHLGFAKQTIYLGPAIVLDLGPGN